MRRRRAWLIAGLVMAAVAAVAISGYFYVFPRYVGVDVQADQLEVGDCVRQQVDDAVLPPVVTRVHCDGPHFGEVFATATVPDDCGSKIFEYAPDIPDGPIFRVVSRQHGNGSVICVAFSEAERWASIRD